MLILNAFTKLQAALFSAFAALAAPGAAPVEELEQIVVPDEGSAAEQELNFTDEVDPSERSRWRCYDDDDHEWRGYCLVRCDDDDHDEYQRVTDKIKIRGNRDFCRKRARRYCNRRGDHVDDWCFGERKWDDDDHDWDDDDKHDDDKRD